MEQLMQEVERYAASRGIKPSTVLQYVGMSGQTWKQWRAGAGCTMSTAAKIRDFMASNPVTPDGLACAAKGAPTANDCQPDGNKGA